MKILKYYTRIYFMIASQYLKERMQYRADFVCDIVGMVFANIFGIASFWVIFTNINELAGWNFQEILFIYGFSLIAMSPQQLLLDNAWTMFHKVVSGEFIKYCFRPINILFYFMSETVDVKGFSQFVLGLVILIISWGKLAIPVTLLNLVMFLFLMFGASLICMGLIILSSTFGFMGGGTNAAIFLASNLKGYAKYPLTIFNKFLQGIFTFLIPIGFIAYYPASYFLGNKGGYPVLTYLSPVIGLAFFLISCKIWIHFADRYAGTGS